MQTKIIKIDKNKPNKKYIKLATEIIKSGGLIISPTDTVYGFLSYFFNDTATTEIYTLSLHDALPI